MVLIEPYCENFRDEVAELGADKDSIMELAQEAAFLDTQIRDKKKNRCIVCASEVCNLGHIAEDVIGGL